jgi:hypothetical protein
MLRIEDLAKAALDRDALELRGLTLEIFRANTRLTDIPRPALSDPRMLAVAASLLELFAERMKQQPPPWTSEVGPLDQPYFLIKAAETMPWTRQLCERESPAPLRKRGFYAPPNFLEFA